LYHNGNSQVIALYRNQFANLKFCGNWAEANERPATGCLWEVCFADATVDNLLLAADRGVKIIRHISTYQDDMNHLLSECERFEYNQWINHAVTDNLCFANVVVSEFQVALPAQDSTVIVTTGRTANTHLQEVYKNKGKVVFESSKRLDSEFFMAKDSVLLWRLDQWACLTSTWIAQQTGYTKSHQLEHRPALSFDHPVLPLDLDWVNSTWKNLCKITLDQAILSKYVCNRPTSYTTTEFVTANFKTVQKPIPYSKQNLIPNYDEMFQWYNHAPLAKHLTTMYNNVITHLTPWSSQ
jgi:hypothetical protein